jgi:hypothetical protein
MEAPHGTIEQRPYDWFGGEVSCQLVQIALDGGSRRFLAHSLSRSIGSKIPLDYTAVKCCTATLTNTDCWTLLMGRLRGVELEAALGVRF